MPRFETFKKSLIPLGQQPCVTLQKRGTITLNKAAHLALGSPDAVELLYDRDAHILGLRPTAVDVKHASFVRPSTKSGNGPFVISAMAFIRFYAIDTAEARRWPAHLKGTVLYVDLDGPSTVVSKQPNVHRNEPLKPAPRPRPRPSK